VYDRSEAKEKGEKAKDDSKSMTDEAIGRLAKEIARARARLAVLYEEIHKKADELFRLGNSVLESTRAQSVIDAIKQIDEFNAEGGLDSLRRSITEYKDTLEREIEGTLELRAEGVNLDVNRLGISAFNDRR
jgi:phosphate uptake regulator